MRHILILLFALCVIQPVSAQWTQQQHNDLSNKLDNAIREA